MRRLLQKFENRVNLPIEIDEIRDAIIELGIQDRIIFSAQDLDTEVLRGTYYQWREHGNVYGEPIWTTLIIYPENEDIGWQRVICAKELVHVCDKQIVKTQTPEMIDKLAAKVIGPFEGSAEGPADLMASVDKLAAYLGLNLLFPIAARRLAREKIASQEKTIQEIANWAVIPEHYASLVIDEGWDKISELLARIGNGDHFPD